jgi:hypothetical protein
VSVLRHSRLFFTAAAVVVVAGERAHAVVGDSLSGNSIISIYTDHDETGGTDMGMVIWAGEDGSYDTDGIRTYNPYVIARFGVAGASSINTNTSINGTLGVSSTLGVTGATTLSSTLNVSGATTVGGAAVVNNSLFVNNTGGAKLSVNTSANQASLTASGGQGLYVNGSSDVQLKGGTNSGILNLRDGDATGGGVPNGTSMTISGSGGTSQTSTVFQTTTAADGTNVETRIGTSGTGTESGTSRATLQAGSNSISVNSGNYADGAPAVSINGVVGTPSTSRIGVLITGSGQNGVAYTSGDVPAWADVAIHSKSYGLGNPALGSAILVTDYGIQMISPQPLSGEKIVNASGGNSAAGTVENNSGMNSGAGTTNNNIGGNSGSGSVTNNIGQNSGSGSMANNFGNAPTGSSGTVSNVIGQNNGTGTMANSFGGGSGSSVNDFGTGAGQSTNTIGNATLGTTISLRAGNSQTSIADGVNTVSVSSSAGVGGSVLPGATTTSGNSGVVLKDASAAHVVVDRNGRMTSASGTVAQSSASMTITNGYNNVHGFYVDERKATISGGTRSSSLTLDDNGATFSNSNTGGPIRVHGVADGKASFDAVNVRQLFGGIAASMAAAPVITDLQRGENGFGMGMGHYGGYSAVGIGLSRYTHSGILLNVGVSRGIQEGSRTAVRGGIGFKW